MIDILKATVHDPITFYTKGHCYNFSLALKKAFPQAKIVYDQVEGHVYTIIDGIYYDVTGVNRPIKNTIPVTEISKPHRWSDRLDRDNLGSRYFNDEYLPYFRGVERKLLNMFRRSLRRGIGKLVSVENVIKASVSMMSRTKKDMYVKYIRNRLMYLLIDIIYEVDNIKIDAKSIGDIIDCCLNIPHSIHGTVINSYFNTNLTLRSIKHLENTRKVKYGKS